MAKVDSWQFGNVVPSLAGDGLPYVVGQARIVGSRLRVQVSNGARAVETMRMITPEFAAWGAALPATHPSRFTGSGSVYFLLQARPDGPHAVRLRIPGPAFNRPYGACVVLSVRPQVVMALASVLGLLPSEAEEAPVMGAAATETDDDTEGA